MESWVREKRLMKVGRGESWEGERGEVRVWRKVIVGQRRDTMVRQSDDSEARERGGNSEVRK